MAESFYTDADLAGASAAFDAAGVTLGGLFLPVVSGTITHVRFRATPTLSGGTYVGAVWVPTDDDPPAGSGDGDLLGQATFGSLVADSWNTVALGVHVDADVPFRAGVYSSVGRYMARGNFYNSGNITRGNLIGLQDGAAPTGFTSLRNGTFFYATGLSYPQDAFNAASYFVDVVFEPDGGDPAEGSIAANLNLATAITGARASQGAMAAALNLQAALTGDRASAAELAAALNLQAALTGARPSAGALTGALNLQAALTGTRESLGTVGANLNLAASLQGARSSLGTLAAGITLRVALTGSDGQSGREVRPYPFPPGPASGFPWPPRPVKSFQEVAG